MSPGAVPCEVPAPALVNVTVTPAERVVERNLGIAVSGNDVVAASTFETIERVTKAVNAGATGIGERHGRYCGEPGGIENIDRIGTRNPFDRSQSVGLGAGSNDHRSGRELNIYAGGFIAVDRGVKTAAAIDEVVAAATFKKLCCPGWIVAAREVVSRNWSRARD